MASNPPSLHSAPHKAQDRLFVRKSILVQKIVDDLQRGLLDDLINFIKTTKFDFKTSIRQPIPTAVLLGSTSLY